MRVLYVNDDPVEGILRRGFQENNLEIDLLVATTEEAARKYLPEADSIDIVFIDFDMGRGQDTIQTGLVQEFVDAGFGVGKKMLVANSRAGESNSRLFGAGCSHVCGPNEFKFFVFYEILKKE